MELKNPLFLIFGITIFMIIIMLSKKNNKIDNNHIKIANTSFIKKTPYYQKKLKEYKILIYMTKIMCLLTLLATLVLGSRPSKIEKNNTEEYNRDIFLCMDVSSSVDELNYQLVDKLITTVDSLKKERFGISIFNASSIILVPLTEDYEYVKSVLSDLKKAISLNVNLDEYNKYDNTEYLYLRNFLTGGTLENAANRGSSLISEGLASCVYSFPNLEEERSRIIIFSSDNDLAGIPLLSLEEAANISKEKNILVYGIGTTFMKEAARTEFKTAVVKTGGKFYEEKTSSVSNIVNDIEKTSKSVLKKENQLTKTDVPKIPFIIIVCCIFILFFLDKKVNI